MGTKLYGSLKKQLSKLSKESDLSNVVDEFITHGQNRGLSKYTVKAHSNTLRQFTQSYAGEISNVEKIRYSIISLLKNSGDEYYNKRLSIYRQFFEFCKENGILEENPVTGLTFRRHTVRIVDHPDEVIERLLRIMNKDTFSGLRDYAFANLVLDTGIRPSEALQVRSEDIDFSRRRIHVRAETAKTREERFLPVSLPVLNLLEKLIKVRPDEWKSQIPVLCTYDGRELTTRSIRSRFNEYSDRIGSVITPYHLRHVFAVGFIRGGGDPFTLQYIMGHKTMEMTRVYVHVNDKDIATKHAEATPLKNFTDSKRVKNIKK